MAWVDYGDRITRCMFTYKGGKLTFDRMDFFDESNESYADFVAREKEKQEKLHETVESLVKAFIPDPIKSNETNEQWLYRVRHTTHEITHMGPRRNGGTQIFQWRYIYSDDGKIVHGYIVDLDGNIRSDITLLDFDRADFGKPIVHYYSVPKEIRNLAQKSLE